MPPAARIFEATDHGGIIIGPGVSVVIIGGLPAAVATGMLPGDFHVCAIPPPPAGPHPPTPIISGSASVIIGGRPAARIGDKTGCGAGIVSGAFNVLIGG